MYYLDLLKYFFTVYLLYTICIEAFCAQMEIYVQTDLRMSHIKEYIILADNGV